MTAAIHELAEGRLRETQGMVEPNRLRNNLLSSQPMCFNLLAPLAQDLQLATRLVTGLPACPNATRPRAPALQVLLLLLVVQLLLANGCAGGLQRWARACSCRLCPDA